MAQDSKKKIAKSIPAGSKDLPLFRSDCVWAATAILLLSAVVGLWLSCFTFADADAAALSRFLRGLTSFGEMLNSSLFRRLLEGGVLGGVGGFLLIKALPRERLLRAKFDAQIVLLILPVVLVFIPAMTAGFIWDDDQEITANPSLHPIRNVMTGLASTNWNGLVEIWSGAKSTDYFPLKTTMLWIEFQLWGVSAPGYHIVNIVLHAIDAVLVWIVLRRLGIPGAWLAGLVFGVHPVHVESVGWIAERKNTLSTIFYLCSFLAYFDYEEKKKRHQLANFFGIATACAAFGLLSGALLDLLTGAHAFKAYALTFVLLVPLLAALNAVGGAVFTAIGTRYFYFASLLFFVAGLLCKTHVVVLPFVLLLLAWWRHGFNGPMSDPIKDEGERRLLKFTNAFVGGLGVIGGLFALKYLFEFNAYFHNVHDSLTEPRIFASHLFRKGYLDREFWFLAIICIACGIWGLSEGVWGRRLNRFLVRSIAFFQIAVLLGAITVWFQYGRAIGDEDIPIGALARRFSSAGWSVWWYLFKVLIPAHLTTIYHRWPITSPAARDFLPLLGLIWTMVALYRHRAGWARIPFAVMTYFVVTLLPVMGFLKMSYLRLNVLVADHFQYISDIAVIAALCAGAAWLWEKSAREMRPILRPALAVAGVLILSAMMLYSWDRASIYQSEETLWRDTLSKNDDTWQGHNHIGAVLFTKGLKEDQAARYFDARGKPEKANARRALSRAHYQEAGKNFARATELKPDNPECHYNLGLYYCITERMDEGIGQYREAVRIKGDEPSMRTSLANALAQVASSHFQASRKLTAQKNTAEAQKELEEAKRRYGEAIHEYEEILKLDQQERMNAAVHVKSGSGLHAFGTDQRGGAAVQTRRRDRSEHAADARELERGAAVPRAGEEVISNQSGK